MKKLYFLFLTLLISGASFGQVINEFQSNPPGADPDPGNIEIKGTPAASFSGWILSVEADAAPATIDRASSVSGTFDSNGLLVVSIPDLENPSFTLVLVDTFTGSTGDIMDPANLSTLGITTVYDAIGIPDSAADEVRLIGAALGGMDFSYTGDEPEIVFRDTNDFWYAVNLIGDNTSIYDIDANNVDVANFSSDPSIGTSFGSLSPENTATAGISDNNIENFGVYPNPVANGEFRITTASSVDKQVSIFNMLGKQVYSKTVKANQTINVANLTTGIYFVNVLEEGKTATKKLVIK
ncbi:T9SS type A sorting domain-containing protein [Lutibacter sp. TH_r2]|uniref:T9SS type A sorting domain-containing protein n=1 Tax=Lutibacter sp. TH_r2 TaxID=3082083 RepID=UPI0029532FD6|nr:T9SS type A sorting domain-containing protein [Lutibacter sp. TH_r2]MDV7186496.1 T9SS type A sorting domain-containing protein [Lutibacter sp. TH_r2]